LVPVTMPVTDAKTCKKKPSGVVKIFVIVDDTGTPRNPYVIDPKGDDLESLALLIAKVDRFQPGTYNGQPAPIAQSIEIKMEGCAIERKDDTGKKTSRLVLRDQPAQTLTSLPWPVQLASLKGGEWQPSPANNAAYHIYRIGENVTGPKPINTPPAEFSTEARSAKYQGTCIIGLIVDAQGNPQNVHIVRALGMGLDQKAMEAVHKYKFQPAMLEGKTPVPVDIAVEVNFRLY